MFISLNCVIENFILQQTLPKTKKESPLCDMLPLFLVQLIYNVQYFILAFDIFNNISLYCPYIYR